jgi:phosphocarrier protein HPr
MSDDDGGDREPTAGHPAPPQDAVVRVMEIVNKKGLHARASAKFVQTVERFDANVRVTRGSESVGGTSIMGLMMLAAGQGSKLRIRCDGPDADKAMEELEELIKAGFNEE